MDSTRHIEVIESGVMTITFKIVDGPTEATVTMYEDIESLMSYTTGLEAWPDMFEAFGMHGRVCYRLTDTGRMILRAVPRAKWSLS